MRIHAARWQQGRTCHNGGMIFVIKNSWNTRPHPRREWKRVGVSAEISLESCYTYPIFSSRLSNEKICIKSQLTNLDIDQSGGRHHTAAWCSGRRPCSLIVTELQERSESTLKLVGHSKSLLDRMIPVDDQRPDCTNGVRALNIWESAQLSKCRWWPVLDAGWQSLKQASKQTKRASCITSWWKLCSKSLRRGWKFKTIS